MALAWRAGLTGADSTAGPSLWTWVGRVTPQKCGELLSRGGLHSEVQAPMGRGVGLLRALACALMASHG